VRSPRQASSLLRRPRHAGPLDELQIDESTRISPAPPAHEDETEQAPSRYQFLVQSNGMGWLVCLEARAIKDQWLDALAVARRPQWVSDRAANACTNCKTGFGFTRRRCPGLFVTLIVRRHHCRSCGQVFCSSCVPPVLSRALPQLSYDQAVRVCLDCVVKWHEREARKPSESFTPGANPNNPNDPNIAKPATPQSPSHLVLTLITLMTPIARSPQTLRVLHTWC
jgi:hypothetical protein